MRTKYKPWTKPYIEEHTEVICSFDAINNCKNYYLEIGSGKGQFLANMAKNHPDCFFIGMERNVTCAGFTAKKLVESELITLSLFLRTQVKFYHSLMQKALKAYSLISLIHGQRRDTLKEG